MGQVNSRIMAPAPLITSRKPFTATNGSGTEKCQSPKDVSMEGCLSTERMAHFDRVSVTQTSDSSASTSKSFFKVIEKPPSPASSCGGFHRALKQVFKGGQVSSFVMNARAKLFMRKSAAPPRLDFQKRTSTCTRLPKSCRECENPRLEDDVH